MKGAGVMSDAKSGLGPLVAALLASACCLGSPVLITLGVSGAWIGSLTALEPSKMGEVRFEREVNTCFNPGGGEAIPLRTAAYIQGAQKY